MNGIASKEQDETRIGLETDVLESGADLLQDGTSHRREEGTHITGVRVHLMNAFCFSVNGILNSNPALFIQYVIIVIWPRPYTHVYACSRSQGIGNLCSRALHCVWLQVDQGATIPSTTWPLTTFRLLNPCDNMSWSSSFQMHCIILNSKYADNRSRFLPGY